MAFLEYMLLALLGTAGAATPGPVTRTFTADAVTQPGGGTEGVLVQATGGSPGKQAGTGRKGRHHVAARRHGLPSDYNEASRRHTRKGHRRGKVYESGKKATKS